MKQRTDWTERLRERLDDALLTPPDDGWRRLDEALRRQAPQPRRRLVGDLPLPYRLPIAAAVLVGALLTGFYLRPTPQPDPDTAPLLAVRETIGSEITGTETAGGGTAGGGTAGTETLVAGMTGAEAAGSRPTTPPAEKPVVEKPDDDGQPRPQHPATASPSKASSSEASPLPAQSENSPKAETPPQAGSAHRPAPPHASEADRRAYVASLRPQRRADAARTRTSLGLFGGGALAADRSRGDFVYLASSSMASVSGTLLHTDLAARRQNDYARSEFDHGRPWSFGLALRKGFGHGLALETGLVYTQLKSEVRMCGTLFDQRLHLLGVPLRLDWSFVDRPRGGLYLGAGGMLEYCLRARLGDERRSEHGLQASLAAVLGAEYRFTRFAALYAEPEWSYYLTETKLRTIRTDHPTAFTLRVGVRFSF